MNCLNFHLLIPPTIGKFWFWIVHSESTIVKSYRKYRFFKIFSEWTTLPFEGFKFNKFKCQSFWKILKYVKISKTFFHFYDLFSCEIRSSIRTVQAPNVIKIFSFENSEWDIMSWWYSIFIKFEESKFWEVSVIFENDEHLTFLSGIKQRGVTWGWITDRFPKIQSGSLIEIAKTAFLVFRRCFRQKIFLRRQKCPK